MSPIRRRGWVLQLVWCSMALLGALGLTPPMTAQAMQHGESKRDPNQRLSRDYGSNKSDLFDTSHLELLQKNHKKSKHTLLPSPSSPSLRVGVDRIGYILKELCTTEETYKQDLEIMTQLMLPKLEEDQLKLVHKRRPWLALLSEREADLAQDLATLEAQIGFLKKHQDILEEMLATSRTLTLAFARDCQLDPRTPMVQEEWEPRVQRFARALQHAMEQSKAHYDRYFSSYGKLNAQGERKFKTLEAQELELIREKDFKNFRPKSSEAKYFELSITPVQRLPRLILLMGDLLKALPTQGPPSAAYRDLFRSQYRASVILAAINAHQHILSLPERDELEARSIELTAKQKEGSLENLSAEIEQVNRQLEESREAQAIYETEFSRVPL